MKVVSIFGFLLTLCLVCTLTRGQVGDEQPVDMQGNLGGNANPHALLAAKLKTAYPALEDQDAVDIAAILHKARQDPETTWLLRQMREGDGKEHFAEFIQDEALTPESIVQHLRTAMMEIRSVDILFQDPEFAFKKMLEDGLIPPDKVDFYRDEKEMLETDIRRNLYFMLVSYAAAGDYL